MNRKHICHSVTMVAMALAGTGACAQDGDVARAPTKMGRKPGMPLRVTVDGTVITASLDDNAAARDFASLLPLTISLSDHAATEKVGKLPKRLDTKGMPAGYEPKPGDIAYFAPWGNLALFHNGFPYSDGLVRLGSMDAAGIDVLKRAGSMKMTIELTGTGKR